MFALWEMAGEGHASHRRGRRATQSPKGATAYEGHAGDNKRGAGEGHAGASCEGHAVTIDVPSPETAHEGHAGNLQGKPPRGTRDGHKTAYEGHASGREEEAPARDTPTPDARDTHRNDRTSSP